jgi:hypothetical protein
MSEQRPSDEESVNRDHILVHIDHEWQSALAEIRELAINNTSDHIHNDIRNFVVDYKRHLYRWHEASGTLNRMPECKMNTPNAGRVIVVLRPFTRASGQRRYLSSSRRWKKYNSRPFFLG